MIKTIRI